MGYHPLPQNHIDMAKQKGIFRIKGSLGGVTFYEREGQDLARLESGVTKERIMKDPAFKRTRENMSEFGGSASVGKALRLGFSSYTRQMGNNKLIGRVTGIMKSINARGPGNRGERAFEILNNADLLEGFEFNNTDPFSNVFQAPYSLTEHPDRIEWVVTIPDFKTDNLILAPEPATHFRIVSGIAVLSDYTYSAGTGKYAPVEPALNSENAQASSPEIALGASVGGVTVLVNTLAVAGPLPATVGVICVLGIEFFQEINGQRYLLASGNAMRVIKVF